MALRDTIAVEFPGRPHGPVRNIVVRVGIAVGLIVFVALLTYAGRDGFVDAEGDEVTLLDAFYYSTVSVTTTGYGDVRPVSDQARLLTTIFVTPARVLFLILLVGTTLEILAQRSRDVYRRARWRRTLNDHVIICGFGVKGRSALRTLLDKGVAQEDVVVIDDSSEAREHATGSGLAVICGSATSTEVLRQAGVADARSIIVAVNRDDTAVLVTLTARELNPQATIVAAVREEENVHLLRQSGATSVITSADAAGRLLGFAVSQPQITEVLEDLMRVGQGLDIAEHDVGEEDVGPLRALSVEGPVVAIARGEELMRFDDPRAASLEAGDRVVYLRSHRR